MNQCQRKRIAKRNEEWYRLPKCVRDTLILQDINSINKGCESSFTHASVISSIKDKNKMD